MKAQTKVIGGMPNETNKIDWGKPQYLISKDGQIILSTGDYSKTTFSGVAIVHPACGTGDYSSDWAKCAFTPITTPITIEISNTND